MTGSSFGFADDFTSARDSALARRVVLFQHFIEGLDNQPPNIRMMEAGRAWELACATANSPSV